MVTEVVAAIMLVAIPLSVQAGVFGQIFSDEATSTPPAEIIVKTTSPIEVPVLSAALNPEPVSRGGADIVAEDGVLIATGPVGADEIDANRTGGEISVYTVREGDTLSVIAEMFDVTANTILWANDLTSAKAIQPGDTLIILPIAGVRHVVKGGDTVAAIAKKYDGDVEEIIAYNQLDSEEDLTVGATLVIPGGAIHQPKASASTGSTVKKTAGGSSLSHPVPGAIKTQGIHGYNAVDFAGAIGTAIRAAGGGEVIVAKGSGWNGGYGNYVVIRHSNGVQTLYAHLSSLSVGVGATVSAGEVIGGMGNTGRSTGPHLHFEVRGGKNPF